MTALQIMRERRAAKKQELDELLAGPVAEKRDLNEDEDTKFSALVSDIERIDVRCDELEKQEKREQAAAVSRVDAGEGEPAEQRTAPIRVNEPDMYQRKGPNSFYRDLYQSFKGHDVAASERLRRHAVYELETRAVGNTNAAGGSGGEWAPPTWIVDQWINIIRPGRVTANLFQHEEVPVGTSSLNYPKLLTGTSVALQSTQNSALASTDPTTGYVQVGFSTIGGKNVASQQILDQSRNFDEVITSDLAAAYAAQVGTQVFTGTGTGTGTNAVINGLLNATIGTTVTWTQASPTPAGFYGQTGKLLSTFLTNRLVNPTCWVMHPRRWYWLESATDSNGRPLVVPNGQAFNTMATENGVMAAGPVGTFHGIPVFIDPLVPINQGAGTNQDLVYLLKTDDLVLLESGPQIDVFREPYADSLGVLFRLYAYVGVILNRHTESIGVLTGTGLVTPTFAS